MKVLHFNTYAEGGAAKASIRLHLALRESGVESEMLVLYPGDINIDGVSDFRNGFSVWNRFVFKVKNKWLKLRQTKKLRNREKQPELFSFPESVWDLTSHPHFDSADIIHLHWVSGFMNYESFFNKCQKPIVWTCHDFEPFSGGFHYNFGVNDQSYKDLIQSNMGIKKMASSAANVTVISPSKYLDEESQKSELFKRFRHLVLRNGIMENEFDLISQKEVKLKLNLPEDKRIILFVSGYLNYKRKGIDLFLEAIEHLDQKETAVCFVGDLRGDDQPKTKFETFYFPEISNQNELNRIFSAADVYVNPSLADISSNTVIEALCSGCPVVTLETGGIPELTEMSSFAFVAKEKTADSLLTEIEKVLENDFNRESIRNEALEAYSLKSMMDKYKEVYTSVL